MDGGAIGADALGHDWAYERQYEIIEFPADWNQHGKKAGILRNIEMANQADIVVAFWDGESRGTQHMIQYSRQQKKMVIVEEFTKETNTTIITDNMLKLAKQEYWNKLLK